MIRFKNVYALVAMVIVIIIVQTPNLFGQSRSNSGKSAYGLEKHLEEWGEEFDCYFTIEDQSFVIGNSIVSSKINKMEPFEAIQGITDIDSLVGQLKRMLPFAEVRREESNTAVIHIIEKQLLKVKGYPLDIQKDLQYSGNAKEFIDILEGISPNRKIAFQMYSSSYGSNAERDKKFRLQIDSKGKTVRNLLTNWLHLPEMNRILWKIQTWDTKKGLESKLIYNQPICLIRDTVYYPEYGLLSLDSDTDSLEHGSPSDFLSFSTDPVHSFITHAKMPPGKSFKFSDGQVAWAFNNDEPRVHQKAMDYIEKHAGEGVSSQVRWSMLYLSKHKDLKAIPLLIKHIDELYSPVPVRERRRIRQWRRSQR